MADSTFFRFLTHCVDILSRDESAKTPKKYGDDNKWVSHTISLGICSLYIVPQDQNEYIFGSNNKKKLQLIFFFRKSYYHDTMHSYSMK